MFRTIKSRVQLLRRGVYSGSLREAKYSAEVGSQTIELFHSRFNPSWLKQLRIAPQTIVDLGAFDGGDALRFADAFPDCRVVSVEADPTRYSIARRHLAESPVEVLNLAVCETDGPVDWYPATIKGEVRGQGSIFAHTDSYRVQFPFVHQSKPHTVAGTRLDSLFDRLGITDIDLLHMDIEGAETAALRSLGALRPKTVFLETTNDRFIGGSTVAETHRLLSDLDYELVADYGSDRFYISRAVSGSSGHSRLRAA